MRFKTGHFIGFQWVGDGSGYSSKTSAMIAAYHHPGSITWRWALYWQKHFKLTWRIFTRWKPSDDMGSYTVTLPFIGSLSLNYQAHMFRNVSDA